MSTELKYQKHSQQFLGAAGIHAPSPSPTAFPTAAPTTSPTSLEITNINPGVTTTVVTDIKTSWANHVLGRWENALTIYSDSQEDFGSSAHFPAPSQYNYHATPKSSGPTICPNGGGGTFTNNAPTSVVIGCYLATCSNQDNVASYSSNVVLSSVSKNGYRSTNPHHNGFVHYGSANYKFLTVNVDAGTHTVCCGGCTGHGGTGLFIPKT